MNSNEIYSYNKILIQVDKKLDEMQQEIKDMKKQVNDYKSKKCNTVPKNNCDEIEDEIIFV